MPDIRYTTSFIDTFSRANENPIQPPWLRNWSGGIDCSLDSGSIGSPNPDPGSSAQSFHSQVEMDGNEGPIEAWGVAVGDAPLAASFRMGIADDAVGMNGYILRCSNPVGNDSWIIRKYSGGTFSNLATNPDTQLPTSGDLVLMQIDGSDINCYFSTDNGTTWSLIVSGTDTSFRSGLYPHFGANGGEPAWTAVGAGDRDFPPQIYRRPNE
jgi:hypothetical protein